MISRERDRLYKRHNFLFDFLNGKVEDKKRKLDRFREKDNLTQTQSDFGNT